MEDLTKPHPDIYIHLKGMPLAYQTWKVANLSTNSSEKQLAILSFSEIPSAACIFKAGSKKIVQQ